MANDEPSCQIPLQPQVPYWLEACSFPDQVYGSLFEVCFKEKEISSLPAGLVNDGLVKTFRLGHDIGLRKVIQVDDRSFLALTSPHYPSPAYDRMIGHGGMNIASAGTRYNQQIGTAILAITRECGLHCQHCYERFNLGTSEAVPIARWKEVIHDLQCLGTSIVVLSGGEPVARFNGVLELLQSGDKNLPDFHLHTSGQGVTPERARMLKETGLSAVAVGLDDLDADRHDRLRGVRGSFKAAISALQNFSEAGLLTYVNMCATKELIRSGGLCKYFDLAKSLNIGFIQLLEPRPCGGYMTEGEDVLLTKSDRMVVMDFFRETNSSRKFRNYPIVYYVVHAESPEQAGCMMGGLSHFHIDGMGNVNPCVFLPVTFGNILREDFGTIYKRMRKAIPRPLHKDCPSLRLGERLRTLHKAGRSMPVPFQMIKEDWEEMYSS